MYRIRAFMATCNKCRHDFPVPLISDMDSYGQSILHGVRGRAHGHLQVIVDFPLWDFVKENSPIPSVDIWDILAELADPIDSELLCSRFVCPACHSRDVSYGDGRPLDFGFDPTPVTFVRFLSQDAASQRLEIVETAKRLARLK